MDAYSDLKDRSRHLTLPEIDGRGFVELRPHGGTPPVPAEWESLGAQFVVDSERLWHAVLHDAATYTEPRFALIASFESGPELGSWIGSQLP